MTLWHVIVCAATCWGLHLACYTASIVFSITAAKCPTIWTACALFLASLQNAMLLPELAHRVRSRAWGWVEVRATP